MSNKKKDKVPKSGKTRLSDLTPQKQARGGKIPGGIAAAGGPAATPPGLFQPPKKNAFASNPGLLR